MKYVVYSKTGNKVWQVLDKEPSISNDLAIAQAEIIPDKYDWLTVANVREQTDTWTEKEQIEKEVKKIIPKIVKNTEPIYNENNEIIDYKIFEQTIEEEITETVYEEIEVEKSKTYMVCDLVANFRPPLTEEQIAIQKQKRYESLCQQYIREKYSANDENKVVREYLADMTNTEKKSQFDTYNVYVESCKARAKGEIYV